MHRYSALSDDFYVNMNLGTEMELSTNRETVLNFFERLQKQFPSMRNFYSREKGDFILEEDKDQGNYRWCTIETRRLCSGHVNPHQVEDALAQRPRLQAGQAIYVPSGHAVTAHGVSFYAPDSEQAGLLARQQEIENLEKQQRAQALIHEQARGDLVKAEATYGDASQRLVTTRREASDARQRAHELQVETLRLTQLAEQARARSQQIEGDLAEVDAGLRKGAQVADLPGDEEHASAAQADAPVDPVAVPGVERDRPGEIGRRGHAPTLGQHGQARLIAFATIASCTNCARPGARSSYVAVNRGSATYISARPTCMS